MGDTVDIELKAEAKPKEDKDKGDSNTLWKNGEKTWQLPLIVVIIAPILCINIVIHILDHQGLPPSSQLFL